jgi:D-alanyl-lipoteichoic acid acyltransferase DltB (MBOAT superfamily)
MLFNTWNFWAFLAVVLPLYWILPFRWQNRMLIVASYYFYGCWNWRFLPLIAGSTLMDYVLGIAVARAPSPRAKKRLVAISVVVNLALLGFFKYYGFFAHEAARFFASIGVPLSLPFWGVVLPVGISFYTFQSMSYVIDISRGTTQPARNFRDFALYVSFFPHLVAGPIMRSGNTANGVGLLKQLQSPRHYRDGDFQEGLYHVLLGLFKKVVVGDNMATLVNAVFQTPAGNLTGPECVMGVYAFAFQIYADFSGYSSIAQGVAKWMGIDLMTNFRMPYLAVNPSDFWHRWHISLSTWLRDYVYIPLGGNRGGNGATYRNLMITMVLGGIWHGANWTFVAWGTFHGALLCAFHWLEPEGQAKSLRDYGTTRGLLRAFLLFQLVGVGWLLFRANTVGQAWGMLARATTDLTVTPLARVILESMIFYVAPLFLYEFWVERKGDLTALVRSPWRARAAVYAYGLSMLMFFPAPTVHEFIYFQF